VWASKNSYPFKLVFEPLTLPHLISELLCNQQNHRPVPRIGDLMLALTFFCYFFGPVLLNFVINRLGTSQLFSRRTQLLYNEVRTPSTSNPQPKY